MALPEPIRHHILRVVPEIEYPDPLPRSQVTKTGPYGCLNLSPVDEVPRFRAREPILAVGNAPNDHGVASLRASDKIALVTKKYDRQDAHENDPGNQFHGTVPCEWSMEHGTRVRDSTSQSLASLIRYSRSFLI